MPQRTDHGPHTPHDEAPEPPPSETEPQATDVTPPNDRPDDTPQLAVDHVFKTIRLMLTLFSVLFAVLLAAIGFIGWRTASSIEDTIATTVDRRLASIIAGESDVLATFSGSLRTLKADFNTAREDVARLAGDVSVARESLDLFLAGETDPVGDFYSLLSTIYPRSRLVQSEVLLQPEVRKQAELVFSKLLSAHNAQVAQDANYAHPNSDRQVDAEVLFNAAGVASEFLMPKLASDLAKAAWEKHDTPEHKARMHRSMIATGEADEASALREVYNLLETLDTPHQLHLVLSEVFNVAFGGGQLSGLVDVLEQLKIRFEDRAPSYVWILQANSLLLQGSTADAQRAIVELRGGLEKASQESPMALWFDQSVELSNQILLTLERHPFFQQDAADMRSEFETILEIKPLADGAIEDGIGSERALEDLVDWFRPEPPDSGLMEIRLDETRIIERPSWNWFSFIAESDGHYSVTATAGDADVDPEVFVRDGAGNFLGSDDDSGGNWDSQLIIWLSRGDYAIGVGPALGHTVEGATLGVGRHD